jgi:hypothetical protein
LELGNWDRTARGSDRWRVLNRFSYGLQSSWIVSPLCLPLKYYSIRTIDSTLGRRSVGWASSHRQLWAQAPLSVVGSGTVAITWSCTPSTIFDNCNHWCTSMLRCLNQCLYIYAMILWHCKSSFGQRLTAWAQPPGFKTWCPHISSQWVGMGTLRPNLKKKSRCSRTEISTL